jgi:hypothetical protein
MSVAHHIANQYTLGVSLAPISKTSTANGASVDLLSCEADTLLEVNLGAVTGTAPTLVVKLQDSPDDSTFTDMSGATTATLAAANAGTVVQVTAWNRSARYVRAVFTIGGTSPDFLVGATIRSHTKSADE